MEESAPHDPTLVVGVDGSEASVEALRQAQRLAIPLGAKVLATPPNVIPRVIRGHPRDSLIEASRHADMGSVSSACVAHAQCPVLVVHSPAKDRGKARSENV